MFIYTSLYLINKYKYLYLQIYVYIHKCAYINIMRYKCMITSRASRLSFQVRRHTNVCKYV
jgi:hypothetical protein